MPKRSLPSAATRHTFVGFVLFGLVQTARFSSSAAQSPDPRFCDKALLEKARSSKLDEHERYGPRRSKGNIDRCEGTYGQQHSLGKAVLVGSLRACNRYPRPPAGNSDFAISWRASAEISRVQIRVRSLSGSKPYALDSEGPGAGKFSWPRRLVSELRVRPENLGVRAFFQDAGKPVEVPVAWEGSSAPTCQPQYVFRFDFVPSSTRADVRLRRTGQSSWEDFSLQGSFDSSAWIPIPLSKFGDPGRYDVEVKFDGDGVDYGITVLHTP